ncbi:hypothetical protein MHZ90_16070 [Pantoea sp. ACRSH]|uniref:hypothetical protein n=1 Tax=unclassified Pantoea TaxID=2630326 RepID=UPI001EF6F117|nr:MULTISPECIES: hypothetical protein [unclassified Pantoea]MCG7367633.1 hypothetical protein [Pantoea sp. ACRSH]MCG7398143.1 hypothetical protein [Pantoea sp. ACRSC]
MKKTSVLISLALLSSPCFAVTTCGPFSLEAGPDDGLFRINKVKPESQKVTFLNRQSDYDNIQVQWMLQRADTPGWLGMDYIKRNGKAILNVEAVRTNMDEPRQFWTYDCQRVK